MEKSNKYTLFPINLIEETASILREKKAIFRCYSDLDLSSPLSSSRWRYVGEYTNFKTGKFGLFRSFIAVSYMISKRKNLSLLSSFIGNMINQQNYPEVIFQHDADRLPEKTIEVMRFEKKWGIKSSAYFFYRKAPSWDGDDVDYKLPLDDMKILEREGFEIGYHQNAYELADYKKTETNTILKRDIKFFRENFNLRSFVPHGGRIGPNGEENSDLPHEGPLKNLLWAYNGKCILKDLMWSDGVCEGPLGASDPREQAKTVEKGMRAVFLFHPQYYGTKLREDWRNFPISKMPWWKEVWGL